ncbi:AHH domain-containing protein [Vibrio parahaemolyticus]|uniref:AHH domain-containing protein n=1 Tax=Vibrio parahaemolyticus TaxID=670 RepID=UPI00301B8272
MQPRGKPLSVPLRPKNPTALELAVHRYEVSAIKLYNQSLDESDPKSLKASQEDLKHLKILRRSLSAQVSLQKQLTEYQKRSAATSPDDLMDEPHHPTRVLARNLTSIGDIKPTKRHDPHHIIMGSGQFRKMEMMLARFNLHTFGLGINDPSNGVCLPRNVNDKGHWSSPDAEAHKKVHRYNYETWIVTNLSSDSLKKDVFINRLRNIKIKLKTSTYPEGMISSKNPNWNGE